MNCGEISEKWFVDKRETPVLHIKLLMASQGEDVLVDVSTQERETTCVWAYRGDWDNRRLLLWCIYVHVVLSWFSNNTLYKNFPNMFLPVRKSNTFLLKKKDDISNGTTALHVFIKK